MKNIIFLLLITTIFYGCKKESMQSGGMGAGSNIPYLKQNHSNYKDYGANFSPKPKKLDNQLRINWTIEAQSENDANKLREHIEFMVDRLKRGYTPRGWDKLFLMEAYMKQNHYYTTNVEQNGKIVVVSKVAKNRCAYSVISAHADAVGNDFFARGVINKDYSSIAENILNSTQCSSLKSDIEDFISKHKMMK